MSSPLDGIIAQIGGAARGSFNLRFGQASRDAHPYLNFFYPTDIFPFADVELTDPATGQTGGMLSDVPEEFLPKVYNVNSSYEYWGRVASLLTTTLDGTAHIPMMDETARTYHLAASQHLPSEFPPHQENGQGEVYHRQIYSADAVYRPPVQEIRRGKVQQNPGVPP